MIGFEDSLATRPKPGRPAEVKAPEEGLSAFTVLRTVVRNPIEAWPRAVYQEPVYRSELLGRETVFVMDPDLIGAVLVEQARNFQKAEAAQRSLQPALGEGLLTADGQRWRWQRRAAAPTFRHERILGFVPVMAEAARRTRAKLLARGDGEFDMAGEMMRTTFDIIVATMLSGGASLDTDRIERAVTDYLDTTSWVIALTMLKAPRWMPYPGRGKATRAAGYLRSECLRIVSERRASGQERNDLLSLLLEAADPETGQRMSDRELADNVLTFMTAGHETTALALTWTFYLLSLHPEVEERVRAEVDAVVGAGEIASEHVKALPYTSQVIQESMRLYPPAPLVVREPIQPTSIGPLRLNPGTAVYIPIYAVHRHHRLWEAPATFDPDRFEPAQIRARHRYSYLPFGAGPRVCIGMSFALTEAVVILATILQGAQLRLRPNYVPVPKLRVTLRPALGMPMRVVRCEHESR